MELSKVPRTTKGTWVRVLVDQDRPPDSLGFRVGDLVLFFRTDGMYSYCKNRSGQPVYLKARADVEVVGEET